MRVQLTGEKGAPLKKKIIGQAVRFIERALIEGLRSGRFPGPKGCEKKVPPPLSSGDLRSAPLVIAFVSENHMKRLNRQFRGKDRVTDVLSFAPVMDGGLGELALCSKQIKKQAESQGLSFEEEAFYLILHGVLHLLGYRHEQGGREAEEMYQIQDDIFQTWRASRRPGDGKKQTAPRKPV